MYTAFKALDVQVELMDLAEAKSVVEKKKGPMVDEADKNLQDRVKFHGIINEIVARGFGANDSAASFGLRNKRKFESQSESSKYANKFKKFVKKD